MNTCYGFLGWLDNCIWGSNCSIHYKECSNWAHPPFEMCIVHAKHVPLCKHCCVIWNPHNKFRYQQFPLFSQSHHQLLINCVVQNYLHPKSWSPACPTWKFRDNSTLWCNSSCEISPWDCPAVYIYIVVHVVLLTYV